MDFNDLKEQIESTPDHMDAFASENIDAQVQLFAGLGTVPLLFFLAVLIRDDSRYIKFYADQGLLLTILAVASAVICGVLGVIFGLLGSVGAAISTIISFLFGLVIVVMWGYLIVNIMANKAKQIPLIGDLIHVYYR